MNAGERCLIVHGGLEVEGVVKSYHKDLDQVLVAVYKASGGYIEILRSAQDVRLLDSGTPVSSEWPPADSSDAEEVEAEGTSSSSLPHTSSSVPTPMDLDSEERATAVFLASLAASSSSSSAAAAQPLEPSTGPPPPPPPQALPTSTETRPGSWTDSQSFSVWETSTASRSAPVSNFLVTGRSLSELLQQHQRQQQQQQQQKAEQSAIVEDVDAIARIMEISLNASSPPGHRPAATFRPIVYLATSPPNAHHHLDDGGGGGGGGGGDGGGGGGGVLLAARAGGSLSGVHSVSRPINIPVRRTSREMPAGSGLHGSPKRAHIAHLVLSEAPAPLRPPSLSSSASSSAPQGSLPLPHLASSLSPPASSSSASASSASVFGSGGGGSGVGRRVRSDVKKCRKVYGVEHRDQWCNQCRWKKACTRFPDPTSPPRHP